MSCITERNKFKMQREKYSGRNVLSLYNTSKYPALGKLFDSLTPEERAKLLNNSTNSPTYQTGTINHYAGGTCSNIYGGSWRSGGCSMDAISLTPG